MTRVFPPGTRDMNYERLVQLAIEQNPEWGWTGCCVCGETSTHAGIVLLHQTATLARIGWCDRDECQGDMAGTKVALPTSAETVANLLTTTAATESEAR